MMNAYARFDSAYAWQQPDFFEELNRTLLPTVAAPRQAPKKPKQEKERLYKLINRRVIR